MGDQIILDSHNYSRAGKCNMLRWVVIFCGLSLGVLLQAGEGRAQATSQPSVHVLGAGDQISLRVVQWREDAREFRLLDAVNGTYSIQPDGTLTVVLAGVFEASGRTTNELADAIATALKRRLGSVESPSAVVEVLTFSPLYIIGDVDRPGALQATPGLTAIQAFALAGGAPQFRNGGLDNVTSGLRDAGNLFQTRLDLLRARIASVRLEAESEGHETLTFPDNLQHPEGPDVLAILFEEERQIFQARRTALAREQSSLSELITLLQVEVTSLEAKISGLQTQLAFAEQNLENITILINRGLARSPQLSTAQRGLFELETKVLDLQNGIFRAQQSIKEAERDLVGLKSNRVTMAAVELQDVNAKIEALRARSDMLRNVVLERGAGASNGEGAETLVTTFDVQRGRGEARQTLSGPDTVLAPGDIVTVAQMLVPQSADSRP